METEGGRERERERGETAEVGNNKNERLIPFCMPLVNIFGKEPLFFHMIPDTLW